MDKAKVITAYRRGLITIQECSQILGVDFAHVMNLMNEPRPADSVWAAAKRRVYSGNS